MKIYIDDGPELDGELTIDHNSQVMWSEGPRPDLKWRYTDREGHEHHYGPDNTLPTLRVEYEHIPCDGTCGDSGCEGVNVAHYFCPSCGEEVEPGLIHGPYQFTVTGPVSWSVTVRDWVGTWVGQVGDQVEVRVEPTAGVARAGRAVVADWQMESSIASGRLTTVELAGVGDLSEVEPA